MLKKITKPKCADCGSSDIVLEGQGVWDAALEIWIIPSPDMQEHNGAHHPIDDTASFFCRRCGEVVGVKT